MTAANLELGFSIPRAGLVTPARVKPACAHYKIIALREAPPTAAPRPLLDTPEKAADYLRAHLYPDPLFDSERECFMVILLDTRRRVRGHQLLTLGTLDTILVHPRDVFRLAIIMAAAAVIIAHNHPSGDPAPSEADIKVTRDLIRAGQLLKIEILDHVILGQANSERLRDYSSMRELGYFYS